MKAKVFPIRLTGTLTWHSKAVKMICLSANRGLYEQKLGYAVTPVSNFSSTLAWKCLEQKIHAQKLENVHDLVLGGITSAPDFKWNAAA